MANWKKALISCMIALIAATVFQGVVNAFAHGWISCMAFYVTFEFLSHDTKEKA